MVFVRAESMLPPEERGLSLRLGSGVVSFWAVDIARTGGTVHVQTILPLPLLCICTRTSTARTTSVAASDADDQLGYIRRRRCTSAPQRCVKIHNVIQYAPRPTPPPRSTQVLPTGTATNNVNNARLDLSIVWMQASNAFGTYVKAFNIHEPRHGAQRSHRLDEKHS
jgi:hypothetical protein